MAGRATAWGDRVGGVRFGGWASLGSASSDVEPPSIQNDSPAHENLARELDNPIASLNVVELISAPLLAPRPSVPGKGWLTWPNKLIVVSYIDPFLRDSAKAIGVPGETHSSSLRDNSPPVTPGRLSRKATLISLVILLMVSFGVLVVIMF
jgi:hypothetical protein